MIRCQKNNFDLQPIQLTDIINSKFDTESSNQVTKIPDHLFYQCHINLNTFSKYTTTIGFGSFYEWTSIEVIRPFILPNTIEYFEKV